MWKPLASLPVMGSRLENFLINVAASAFWAAITSGAVGAAATAVALAFPLLPTWAVVMLGLTVGLLVYGALHDIRSRRGAASGAPRAGRTSSPSRLLDIPEGRKLFVDGLVVFHAQGVGLQTGADALWPTEQQMVDWLTRDGQWVGELLGHMRQYGCSHAEIHDIGYLTPPRYVGTFPLPSVPPITNLAGRHQAFVTERLHRIKELMKKYDS